MCGGTAVPNRAVRHRAASASGVVSVMNRRIVAGVAIGALVLGSLGGLAAAGLSGGATPSNVAAGESGEAPDAWLFEARAVYDAIAPVTEQAGQAVTAGDDAAYAAANGEIAQLLDGMPTHPNDEVNALYAAIAQAHRDIEAAADIDGDATVAAQDRAIVLLERVHQIVPPF